MKFLRLLPLAVAVVNGASNSSTDGVTVDYVGASGGLKLYLNDNANKYIFVQQDKLEEVTADGKATNNTLNMTNGEWSDVVTTKDGNKTDYSVSYTKTDGDVAFQLVTHLSTEAMTIQEEVPCNNCSGITTGVCQNDAGECAFKSDGACPTNSTVCTTEIQTKKDQLKFSIMVSGWTFKNSTNKLAYALSIKSKGGKSNNDTESGDAKMEKSGDDEKVTMDGGFLVIPTTDMIRGGDADVVRNVSVELNSGSKTTIDFLFDSFTEGKTMYYDADIGTGGDTVDNGSAMLIPSIVGVALSALTFMFGF